jgi:hypothetical protein
MNIVNIKSKPTPSYDLYIGRVNVYLGLAESKWANPFPIKKQSDRPGVIYAYLKYLLVRPTLIQDLSEIDNQILGCYCHPKRCHGEVLLELRKLQVLGVLTTTSTAHIDFKSLELPEDSIFNWISQSLSIPLEKVFSNEIA